MSKLLLLLALLLGGKLCFTQNGYVISGRIQDVEADQVLLLSADNETDTLSQSVVTNGAFFLNGQTDGPRAAYLQIGEISFLLLVENATFQISVSPNGVAVGGGGEAWKLYSEFGRIGREYAAVQAEAQKAIQQPGADIQVLQAKVDAAYQTSVNKTLELIKTNPDAYVSAFVIAAGIRGETEESLRAKYDLLGEAARNTVPGERIAAALARYEKLAPGNVAPDFTIPRPNGDALTLSNITAKIKLIVFWASWDAASRQASPELISLYQAISSEKFRDCQRLFGRQSDRMGTSRGV